MDYYDPITDKNGYVHSIDRVVFQYYLKQSNFDNVINDLKAIRTKHNASGWERLHNKPCAKYSWFQHSVNINGIFLSIGQYQEYIKEKSDFIILPLLRLEVNPNKHANSDAAFYDILKWIRSNCSSGELKKYDYAIDVSVPIRNIFIKKSRKEPGLYKGTIYRGQRNRHGQLRIYNKAESEKLTETTLTRIEHVQDPREKNSFEDIYIFQYDPEISISEDLDSSNLAILGMCQQLAANGLDYEPYLKQLNYRRRKKIQTALVQNMKKIEYDPQILDKLLSKIHDLFDADKDNTQFLSESSDNFIEISDDYEVPFS